MLTAVATLANISAFAQSPDTHGACISTETPSIDGDIPGSTYEWGILGGSEGDDWTLTPTTGTTVTIEWKTPGDYTLWSQETNQWGCIGPKTEIAVTVASFTVLDATTSICSTTQPGESGTPKDVVGITLPTEGSCNATHTYTIDKWIITSIDNIDQVTPGEDNAELNVDLTSADAIENDIYTNETAAPVTLTYHITPYAGTVEGSEFLVSVTVYPQVKAPKIKW